MRVNYETIDRSLVEINGSKCPFVYARVARLTDRDSEYNVQIYKSNREPETIRLIAVFCFSEELDALNFFMSLTEPEDFPPGKVDLGSKCHRSSINCSLMLSVGLEIQGLLDIKNLKIL